MSGFAFVVIPLSIAILLYFIFRKPPTKYPTGKVLCLEAKVPMYQVILLDSIDPQIRVLANSIRAPILVSVGMKLYISVPQSPSFSILFVDDNQSLGIVSLVKLGNNLKYGYAGTASEGSFLITIMDSYSNLTPTVSANFPNLPVLVSNINLLGSIPYSSYNTNGFYLPSNSPSMPKSIALTSYNVAPISVSVYSPGIFTPYMVVDLGEANMMSDPITVPSLKNGEALMFIGYNYSDGSLSACMMINQSGKCFCIYLFGGTISQPDFSISIPSTTHTLSSRQEKLIKHWIENAH